jgi:hypothetical protein
MFLGVLSISILFLPVSLFGSLSSSFFLVSVGVSAFGVFKIIISRAS